MNETYTAKPKLYVGCALTNAPEDFRNNVEEAKVQLGKDWEVMQFLGLQAGTSADVYNQDITSNVRTCEGFLAIADHPANGLGWELGVADERETPTLIVVKFGAVVSRLLIGASEAREHIQLQRYEDMSEIPAIAREVLMPMIK